MNPTLNVQTTTNQFLAPKWVDQILRSNLFFGEILAKTEKWSGSQMLFPIKYQKGVASVPFNGFDVLPVTQQQTTVNMTFFPSFVATNVAVSGNELSVNQAAGKEKILDLMTMQMKSRAQDAADDIGNLLYSDGTSSGGKAPAGLGNIVDNGSTAATYGGLSRSTYSGLNATVTASGGTVSLLKIRQLANAISDDLIFPDMGLTDYNTWALVEQLLQTFQRNTYTDFQGVREKMNSAAGFRSIIWDGIVIMKDKKCPAGNLFLLNTDLLKFYGLKWWDGESVSLKSQYIKGNVYEDGRDVGNAFTWTGWVKAYNQGAMNGFMIFAGQLISEAPFRNGKLTGITSI